MIKLKFLALNANSLNNIQIVTAILFVIGMFHFEISLNDFIVSILFFYIYSIIGVSMMLHRFYSHKYFEFKYKIVEHIFSLIAIMSGRGSPLGWTYMHMLHHAYSDSNRDPHSPNTIGFRLIGFKYKENSDDTGKTFLVRRLLTKHQQLIHNYYFYIIIFVLALIAIIDIKLVYITWVIPILILQCSQNSFNYFAHKYGYVNYATKDQSKNNCWLWFLVFGDAWHNNHHGNPSSVSTRLKKWELDPVNTIINLVKK